MKKLIMIFIVLATVSFASEKKAGNKTNTKSTTNTQNTQNTQNTNVQVTTTGSSFVNAMMPTTSASNTNTCGGSTTVSVAPAPIIVPMDVVSSTVTAAYGAR